jgi:transcriptional regulator with XRE-family HTH domain
MSGGNPTHEELTRIVADNARRLRVERRLTLGQLAARSGVSKATLSKLELGETNPTLETLATLARALSVGVAELLEPAASSGVQVVRRGEGADLADSAAAGRLVNVQRTGTALVEVHSLTFEAGHSETSATHGDGSWEHVMVLSGRVWVGPLDAPALLEAGDYALYRGDQAHLYKNDGDVAVRMLLFLLVPRADAG